MDAFFASVEQLDDPSLRGKPIAVSGGEDRGVISAASYEARKYGVRSAMTGKVAKKLCPKLIFVKTNFKRYKEVSNIIRKIFLEYTDLVEPLSLDEAYLDVSVNKINEPVASKIAQQIRIKIHEQTGITASAGISINKFLAKIASDINKPNGQKTIKPKEIDSFVKELPIEKFYGIGRVTQQKMYKLGIYKGEDLRGKSLEFLIDNFKNSGKYYYRIARGISNSEVKPNRIRKSVGVEHTFMENISSEIFVLEKIKSTSKELESRLKNAKVKGKTITLKIKYSDFKIMSRSKTSSFYFNDNKEIYKQVKSLLLDQKLSNSVRLVGISMSNLDNIKPKVKKYIQLEFDFG